jgi:hypothetical protein
MSNEASPQPSPSEATPVPAAPAQSLPAAAGKKSLAPARWILIASGLVWLGVNGYMFTEIGSDADRIVQKIIDGFHQQGRDPQPGSDKIHHDRLTRRFTLVIGGSAALGLSLIVLGALIQFFPVLCTVAGLAATLVATVGYWRLSPEMTSTNWAWKFLTILALLFAVYWTAASPKAPQASRVQKKPPQKEPPQQLPPQKPAQKPPQKKPPQKKPPAIFIPR